MLIFQNPDYLWYLIAIPIIAVGLFILNRINKKQLYKFVSQSVIERIAPDISGGMKVFKQILFLLSLACIIITLANPQVGTKLEEVKREGIDLFIALDVSLSMKSEDIKPSRLEKAKRDVSDLLHKLAGDRVGMIVFAGDAFVQFPLTSDYSAADLFLSSIDVDAVPIPGTMIGSAIDLALKSFSKDMPTQKAIVIVSDGENTEGDYASAVDDAKKNGVKIFSVGMGTIEGGPIPITNQEGNRIDFKKDMSGNIVVTKLDENVLQQIALETGGSYYRASSGGNEISEIFKKLSSIEKVEYGSKQVTGYESRYQYPLFFAVLFLLIEVMLSNRKSKIFNMFKKIIPAGIILLIIIFSSITEANTIRSHVKDGNKAYKQGKHSDAEAEYKKALNIDPKSKSANYNLGNAYYKQERYDEALQQYQNTSKLVKTPKEMSKILYNAGNTLYKSNKVDGAIEAYKQALKLNPEDEDIRKNLQIARIKKQQKNQQQKDQKQDQQKNNKDDKNQQQKQNPQNEQQNKEQKQEERKQQQAQQKNQMPKQEADRILEAMKNNEKEIQKNLRKREAVRIKVDKDW